MTMASFTITRRDGSRHEVLVDDEDYDAVMAARWIIDTKPRRRAVYAYTHLSEHRTQYLHRFVLQAPKGVQVDHVNCDGLDNRKANLRLCTQSQNNGNVAKFRTSASPFKGVYYNKEKQLWQAQIKAEGRARYLGRFDTAEEAHEAYKRAALKVFGEFARFE